MTFFFALAAYLSAYAQVANDNIENRRVLRAEETVTSSTVGCTVQRSCVDERLTGKCIEYHNDQWFEFRPTVAGTYYVNIGGQRCRDVRGVQLVVLTGTPCEPATYRVLSCNAQPWLDAGLRQVAVTITCYPPRGATFTEHLLLPLGEAPAEPVK